jgi:hypothetical protein
MAAATRWPNKGHDTCAIKGWLGHRSITSTAVYTALAPWFKDFWRDYLSENRPWQSVKLDAAGWRPAQVVISLLYEARQLRRRYSRVAPVIRGSQSR